MLKHKLPLSIASNKSTFSCVHCSVAKCHRLPFTLSNSTVNNPLALIHSDVWGPFNKSASPYKYYVLFIDDFTRFTWLYPLVYKSEMCAKFMEFKAFVEKQFGFPLKILRSDGGGEYKNHPLQNYLHTHGIHHQFSCPHTPSQNGVAERKHLHLTETAISLLHQSSMPLLYWFDAIAAATYLINRLPSVSLNNCSPFELLYHTSPDYSLLKVFGCLCFPWLKPYASHKLAPTSTPCVFLGYHPSVKGYRCLDPQTGHIHLSRHVTFHEHEFPFSSSTSVSSVSSLPLLQDFFWSPSPQHSYSQSALASKSRV